MTLLHLAFRCTCGNRPNLRAFPCIQEAVDELPDDEPVMTWQCRCGEVHVLVARAFKLANGRAA